MDIPAWLLNIHNAVGLSGYAVLAFNLLIFLFSKTIINALPSRHQTNYDTRLKTLRIINLALFLMYVIGVLVALVGPAFDSAVASKAASAAANKKFSGNVFRKITYTGLVLLITFMCFHFFHVFLIKRYGREKEIDGTVYKSETYQSEIFSLFALIVAIIVVVLSIINIWELTSLLQATSVLGALVLVTYATKDVWAPDNINGLILLYNGNVEPGSLVRIKEQNLMAIVLQTTLTQTVMKDLVSRHQIVMPNSLFRNSKIEILTKATAGGLIQYADFKIAYGASVEDVEIFLYKVWSDACVTSKALNSEQSPRMRIAETGDHAVVWRLFYVVGNVYRLTDVNYAINQAAYVNSMELGISLQTPITHSIQLTRDESA